MKNQRGNQQQRGNGQGGEIALAIQWRGGHGYSSTTIKSAPRRGICLCIAVFDLLCTPVADLPDHACTLLNRGAGRDFKPQARFFMTQNFLCCSQTTGYQNYFVQKRIRIWSLLNAIIGQIAFQLNDF
jgi:hypothetical protein